MSVQTTNDEISAIWQLFRATDARFKETDAKFKETDERLDRRFSETDAKLRRLEGLLGDQWGRLLEALVQPNALELFRRRGIPVQYIYPRAKYQLNGDSMEIDLLLDSGREVVVVEIKSTVKVDDVNDALDRLARFPRFFPHYAHHRIYGAIAGLSFAGGADRYAYRSGLFVLGFVGEGMVKIRNDENFRPRDFSAFTAPDPG